MRENVFEILSERFGRMNVLLDYPFEKMVEGFVLTNEDLGKTSIEIYNLLKSFNPKNIGLIIPISRNELENEDKELRIDIAIEILNEVINEIDCEYIKNGDQLIAYEDLVKKLKDKINNKKILGGYTKSIISLILFGYGFREKEVCYA